MTTLDADIAIVGAGILGLAHAYAAARRGYKVVLFERDERAVGASVRNFGLPWPVGLALTPLYERALHGRATWLDLAARTGFWCQTNGALFLAYHADEEAVLNEFQQAAGPVGSQLLTPAEAAAHSPAVKPAGLRAALFSSTELTVDPREAIRLLPAWLAHEYGVVTRFRAPVRAVRPPRIEVGSETWRADHVMICNGADFETLYPQTYRASGLTRCKLQMWRTAPQPGGWRLGPTLAAGLTLARYDNFAGCPSIEALRGRLRQEWPGQTAHGIHVLLAQNELGECVIGGSHEDGFTFDPFDQEEIYAQIQAYLGTFACVPVPAAVERWHGVYPKLAGRSELVLRPEPGVSLVQITNGLGMTLAFSLAEEVLDSL